MILRIFRAIVRDGRQAEFRRFVLETALPLVQARDGMVQATVGLPRPETPNEFSLVTVWRDLDALIAFTGDDWQSAVPHPDEAPLSKRPMCTITRWRRPEQGLSAQ